MGRPWFFCWDGWAMHAAGNEEAGGRKLTHPFGQLHLQGCLVLARCAALPTGIEGIRLRPDHMCLTQMSPRPVTQKRACRLRVRAAKLVGSPQVWGASEIEALSHDWCLLCPVRPCYELCSHIISPTSLS